MYTPLLVVVIQLVLFRVLIKLKVTPKKFKIKLAKMYKELHWSGVYRVIDASMISISICTFYALLNPVFSNAVGIISYLLALLSLVYIVKILKHYYKVLKKIQTGEISIESKETKEEEEV